MLKQTKKFGLAAPSLPPIKSFPRTLSTLQNIVLRTYLFLFVMRWNVEHIIFHRRNITWHTECVFQKYVLLGSRFDNY